MRKSRTVCLLVHTKKPEVERSQIQGQIIQSTLYCQELREDSVFCLTNLCLLLLDCHLNITVRYILNISLHLPNFQLQYNSSQRLLSIRNHLLASGPIGFSTIASRTKIFQLEQTVLQIKQ